MTATNPNLIELQRKVKEANKNVTAAKKVAIAAKNAVGKYYEQMLHVCGDKGLLVDTIDGWESSNGRFYLRVENNKVSVRYKSEWGWTFEEDPIDDYMSRLEDDIRDYKELYEETGDKSYVDDMNEKKATYDVLKSIVDVLYN